jgi:cystathionine beta-lyase/cystathionine gamma-synthase
MMQPSSRPEQPPADDLCPRPEFLPPLATQPLAPPLYTSAVYRCDSPRQAAALLSGEEAGFVYSRDGHPNAWLLAEKCRALHGTQQAVICGSGMSALSAALLATLQQGDHVVASRHLYGQSLHLLTHEAPRLGIQCTLVETCDLQAVRGALTPQTRLLVVETIANPLLRVADIAALADVAHRHGALLLVDNTFAGPSVVRPAAWGADFVLESLTKIINGHSDVLLGLLAGGGEPFQRVPSVVSAWGLMGQPFDCWLALRGLSTLPLRAARAGDNALRAAQFLTQQRHVVAVHYPGLPGHPDHALAARQFGQQFGSMVTFELQGGWAAAERFIAACRNIPFCPSLGDLSTTLSHPASTSHRRLAPEQRTALGIADGTIRLSLGVESPEAVIDALAQGLAGLQ